MKTARRRWPGDSEDTQEGLSIIKYFLLGFGGVALFVGSFVIANTLSITVAQRMRELATLRTLGASRGRCCGRSCSSRSWSASSARSSGSSSASGSRWA